MTVEIHYEWSHQMLCKQEMKMLIMFHGTDMRVGLIMRRKIRRNFYY